MKFGNKSLKALNTCHFELQLIAHQTIKKNLLDFTIIQGYRNQKTQDEAYANGYSKLKWPKSKHNQMPSFAFDFIPYPFIDWADEDGFKAVAELLKETAIELRNMDMISHDIKWGGDWITFIDWPHIQLENI